MQNTITVGIDLAKDVFHVHGIDAEQRVTFSRKLSRKAVLPFFERLPKCLVGMEACGGAHYWARALRELGHGVKVMAARYVKAYAKRGKNDAADAGAICEAASRRHVPEVPVKTQAEQCLLMAHKTRDRLIKTRTQKTNEIRGHLLELGIAEAAGEKGFDRLAAKLRDETDSDIPALARAALAPALLVRDETEAAIAGLDKAIAHAAATDPNAARLAAIPGIGPIGASAFAATATEAKAYPSARVYAASLGLTPRISGTGGSVELGPISKQGNGYLRRLLYLGAVSRLKVVKRAPQKGDPKLVRLLASKPFKVAAIALANEMARKIWALHVRGGTYVANHRPLRLASGVARGF